MKDGNRRDRRSGNLIAGMVAVVVTLLLIGVLSLQSARYERDAADRTANYARDAERQISADCFRFPPTDYAHCVEQGENAKRQYEREEQNLAAQKVTAWWTWIMGAAAVAGVILSAFGVFLVWRTFAETREGNLINKRTAEQELRPYVLFREPDIRVTERNDAGTGYWQFAFDVINNGQTPARIVSVQTGRVVVPHGETPNFENITLMPAPEGSPVIPKEGTATFTATIGFSTLAPSFLEAAGGLKTAQVFARCSIKYRGVTDEEDVRYELDRVRLVVIVQYPGDAYGSGRTEIGDDPRRRLDHVK